MVSFEPDVLILIDYPGFNLRIAKWAKQQGFKVVYYISPQVWAWKENRVKTIKRYVDKMLVILPFEKAFYQKWNYAVDYVGHPLVEVISDFIQSQEKNFTDKQPEDKKYYSPVARKQETGNSSKTAHYAKSGSTVSGLPFYCGKSTGYRRKFLY